MWRAGQRLDPLALAAAPTRTLRAIRAGRVYQRALCPARRSTAPATSRVPARRNLPGGRWCERRGPRTRAAPAAELRGEGGRGGAPAGERRNRAHAHAEGEYGREVLYLPAAVDDEPALARAIQTARAQLGELHGVVHSAMVLEDSRLAEMDEAAFARVLRPKVAGAHGARARDGRPRARLRPLLLVGAVVRRQHRPGELRGRQHLPRRVRRRAAREPPLSRGGRQLGLLERGRGGGERALPAAHGPAGRARAQVGGGARPRSKKCWPRAGSRRRLFPPTKRCSRKWASIGPFRLERAPTSTAGSFPSRRSTPLVPEDAHVFAETEAAMARLLEVTRRRLGRILRELLAGGRSTRRWPPARWRRSMHVWCAPSCRSHAGTARGAGLSDAEFAIGDRATPRTVPGLRRCCRCSRPCVSAYPRVLAGKAPAATVLFPGGSVDLVRPVYGQSAVSRFYNDAWRRRCSLWPPDTRRPIAHSGDRRGHGLDDDRGPWTRSRGRAWSASTWYTDLWDKLVNEAKARLGPRVSAPALCLPRRGDGSRRSRARGRVRRRHCDQRVARHARPVTPHCAMRRGCSVLVERSSSTRASRCRSTRPIRSACCPAGGTRLMRTNVSRTPRWPRRRAGLRSCATRASCDVRALVPAAPPPRR